MREVVIVSAVRTAIGTFNGSLTSVPAADLGAIVIKEALARAGVAGGDVDEVLMGNTVQAGLGQNTCRQASIKAGLPVEVTAMTINKVCGSGLRAVSLGAQTILAGDSDIVVAGGMENMSAAPYVLPAQRWGQRMNNGVVVDAMVNDGLWDAFNNYHMGITAENIAERMGITREEQDAYALQSQLRAEKAIAAGNMKEQIVPVIIPQKKGPAIEFAVDEHPKKGSTIEALAKLRPAFKPQGGTVTAGNASGINDAAAAVVLMSAEKAKALGIQPLAKFRGWASGGVDPQVMGLGPVPATRKVLGKLGMKVSDMGRVEANEAFAVQYLACGRELVSITTRPMLTVERSLLGHPIEPAEPES